MNVFEAIAEVYKGNKVRHTPTMSDFYLYVKDGVIYNSWNDKPWLSSYEGKHSINLMNEDWEIYKTLLLKNVPTGKKFKLKNGDTVYKVINTNVGGGFPHRLYVYDDIGFSLPDFQNSEVILVD